jgi:hypothetical protein
MSRWQRSSLDFLFVAVEAIPWYLAITLVATIGERGFLRQLAREIEFAAGTDQLVDPDRAVAVAAQLRQAAESATSGAPFWIVLLAAFGGFWLIRALLSLRLGGGVGAIALVLASVLGLNVVLHLAFAENLLIWDNGGLANFIDDPQAYVASGADLQAVVDRGGVVIGSGTALAVTFMGMVAVWLRFMAAGRRPVAFERVLRSFGIGFAVVLGVLVFARVNEIGQLAIYSLPFFAGGLLALAVANSERAALPTDDGARVVPWSASVGATMTVLIAVASIFGLLAALDVVRVLEAAGSVLGVVVEWLLIIILTPVFWVLVPLMDLLLPDRLYSALQELQFPENLVEPEPGEQSEDEDFLFPRWPLDVAKVLIFVALVWASYRIGRMLLARRSGDGDGEYDEFRTTVAGAGLGGLLRNLLGRRPGGGAGAWLRRHPLYRLYGRSVTDAEDRGFERRPAETPLEYAAAAAPILEAPVFAEIAAAFDEARYGRRYPDAARVAAWSAELTRWESEHPESDEMRGALERLRPPRTPRPPDPAAEFAERVRRGRERARNMRMGIDMGQGQEEGRGTPGV